MVAAWVCVSEHNFPRLGTLSNVSNTLVCGQEVFFLIETGARTAATVPEVESGRCIVLLGSSQAAVWQPTPGLQ